MVAAANLVEVAALVGDTARATMLNALMRGQSLTATELAYCANIADAERRLRAASRRACPGLDPGMAASPYRASILRDAPYGRSSG